MFAKSAVAATLLVFAATAAATEPASSCTTGPVQCCDSTSSTVTPAISALFSLVGINAQNVAVPIGVTCSPITVVGAGSGATCTSQAVCCEDNSYNGIVALGCDPVNLNL